MSFSNGGSAMPFNLVFTILGIIISFFCQLLPFFVTIIIIIIIISCRCWFCRKRSDLISVRVWWGKVERAILFISLYQKRLSWYLHLVSVHELNPYQAIARSRFMNGAAKQQNDYCTGPQSLAKERLF